MSTRSFPGWRAVFRSASSACRDLDEFEPFDAADNLVGEAGGLRPLPGDRASAHVDPETGETGAAASREGDGVREVPRLGGECRDGDEGALPPASPTGAVAGRSRSSGAGFRSSGFGGGAVGSRAGGSSPHASRAAAYVRPTGELNRCKPLS